MKMKLNKLCLSLFLTVAVLPFTVAQNGAQEDLDKRDWFVMDPETDKVQGLSVDKAYELVSDKKSKTVIVAVIDSGIDIDHEDLQGKIWINEDEIPDNGIDDDKNGYIDDRYGWNFIGGPEGNVEVDTYEMTRLYGELHKRFDGVDAEDVKKKDKADYDLYMSIKDKFESTYEKAASQYAFYKDLKDNVLRYHNLLEAYLNVDSLTMSDLKKIDSSDSTILAARNLTAMIFQNAGPDVDFELIDEELNGAVEYFGNQVNYAYNTEFNPRTIVGDDYSNLYEKGYGNNDVKGHDPSHGTHVAGIIAANRANDLGMQGIANDVKIMAICAVPDGDERDKDVANAIIYAVDNGAQIINMSFGKSYSPGKEAVDKAIQYAEKNNVLLVHAAGNSSEDIDVESNFPTRRFDNGKEAQTWLEIGASGSGINEELVGDFSNYGKKTVDVFAPGVDIYSATPGNTYSTYNGTSMAAPATSGVAALLLSYYPDLTAYQVKDIIKKSSRKFENMEVVRPGEEDKVQFSELSITGGLINAYEAMKMAESMKISKD
jgi:subtilisin family serine protease